MIGNAALWMELSQKSSPWSAVSWVVLAQPFQAYADGALTVLVLRQDAAGQRSDPTAGFLLGSRGPRAVPQLRQKQILLSAAEMLLRDVDRSILQGAKCPAGRLDAAFGICVEPHPPSSFCAPSRKGTQNSFNKEASSAARFFLASGTIVQLDRPILRVTSPG